MFHASCVALHGRAVLILGSAGRGKSGLALQLMAYGADLVADDQTALAKDGLNLTARAPATLQGLIEARGVGLLKVPDYTSAHVVVAVDLDDAEMERLPEYRERIFLGIRIPLLHNVDSAYFPAAILQYLKAGRRDPE
ncbi:hypothetical protein KX928_05835 [Roseobacter sp. YSTF-M11]|uniref:HPr kinase/phosphorylase C-terminal domain-containing protein n=1 Tax=Roseobacter insulae TaxID=2859783 RepID=A0A9X1FUV9_9RHOB|nr:hypothetical protein [Roseobacter insulae]MBW4707303.1 hypothetical protein [Roseobacter insulae]